MSEMKTILVLSGKGGSGKTTTTVHLLGAAIDCAIKTVIYDLDPQGSASKWLRRRPASLLKHLYAGMKHGGADSACEVLDTLAKGGAGLVVIDTEPREASIYADLAARADLVLIPAQPTILDLEAISDTYLMLRDGGHLAKAELVLSRVSTNKAARATRQAREIVVPKLYPGLAVSECMISQRTDFADSIIAGMSACEMAPSSKAAQEAEALWSHVAGRLDLPTRHQGFLATPAQPETFA